MSLEDRLAENTAALIALTEAMTGKAVPGPADDEDDEEEEKAPPKRGRPAGGSKKPTASKEAPAEKKPARGKGKAAGPTAADARDALRKVSDECGRDVAKELLGEFEVSKITDLEEEDFKEFIEACEEALEDCEGDDE
jgi:hypothetical protein